MAVDKERRLHEFIRRLGWAAPASTFEEARQLLETTLNTVEDEMSGVPFDSSQWHDGKTVWNP